jgi:transcriptional regulator with XRE-family HTH domain
VKANAERPRLREYRLRLGWTQQEMAERLAHLAWMQLREHVAVNADMIVKWERGVKGVSVRYRALLCHLFGVTPDQLGLKNIPVSATSQTVAPGADESLVGMLDNAARLLDQLGAAGTALAPHMLHAWKDALTTRRTMLGCPSHARPAWSLACLGAFVLPV